jgi:hypothetical protein
MSMTMTLRAESAAAKTAIADAAIFRPSPVRSRPGLRAAIVAPHETHRYRTDGGAAHQRQYNAARTFHGTPLDPSCGNAAIETLPPQGRKRNASAHCIVRRRKHQPPPEKCELKACAKPPKPARATLPEPEGEAPEADLFAGSERHMGFSLYQTASLSCYDAVSPAGNGHEAAGIHQCLGRCGGGMAALRPRPATQNARDRHSLSSRPTLIAAAADSCVSGRIA